MNMARLVTLSIVLLLSGFTGQAHAETIAMIGTGGVSSALGPRFAEQGHTIVYGSRNPDSDEVQALVSETGHGASATTQAKSVIGADIVVLAIPWAPTLSIVQGLGSLEGKIVIDPINAMVFGENKSIAAAAEPSAAALIQQWAPDAYVVKAFNTLTRAYMIDPASSGGPITIPIAGNSAAAKAKVKELTEGLGLEAMDVGDLSMARAVEAMGLMYVAQGYQGRNRFEFHLRRR